jgi:zinc/manganese transport system permease protein
MHFIFLVLVVLNLVAGFRALGTLMAVGLMMIPAASSRFWANQVWSMALAAVVIAMLSGYTGLLLSYHANLPSGPSIILTAGVYYMFSVIFGVHGSLFSRLKLGLHLDLNIMRESMPVSLRIFILLLALCVAGSGSAARAGKKSR